MLCVRDMDGNTIVADGVGEAVRVRSFIGVDMSPSTPVDADGGRDGEIAGVLAVTVGRS